MEEEPDTHPAEAAFILAKLARSDFRRRFRLGPSERSYFRTKGAHVIRRHAADFIAGRLAPAVPPKDGRQTPMRGHPVFVAQHATALANATPSIPWPDSLRLVGEFSCCGPINVYFKTDNREQRREIEASLKDEDSFSQGRGWKMHVKFVDGEDRHLLTVLINAVDHWEVCKSSLDNLERGLISGAEDFEVLEEG